MNKSDRAASVIQYIDELAQQLRSGHAREHAYRPALQRLMGSFDDVNAVNDPARSENGNPDFVFLRDSNRDIILGYAEAKDITVDLDKTLKTEQLRRYAGYEKLFLTNYREFVFLASGEEYLRLNICSLQGDALAVDNSQILRLANELQAFLDKKPEAIRSGKRLAVIMGGKARRIRDNVRQYLNHKEERNIELEKIYRLMKTSLVHDLTKEQFADLYAQTLVYGLFAARYNDETPDDFDRREAVDAVPKTNPFLRQFFNHIAGADFDVRLRYIVDELCDVFAISDIRSLVRHQATKFAIDDEQDLTIHFYEDFLKEYDPIMRQKMGVYYTPVPVVRYIVRSVDKILKEEFGIHGGLASSETIDHWVETGQDLRADKRYKVKTGYHKKIPRVQVLDPAVGTATFLNETIKHIYKDFEGQEGRWPSYVKDNLIRRMHGFELMMAPYTIAHLKLSMTLAETGARDLTERLGIYLTNTLEEGIPLQQDLFSVGLASAVSEESRHAAEIKSNQPIMVVMGNPPYSGESSNKTEYANSLINKYKFEPGGDIKLRERNPKWLNDDYVKFIAFAEDMISKNGSGVVAMITNNGYLDNPTFRGMRWRLTKNFDKIYVLDLHGSSKKKETAPDGTKDENVFDIMQGVGVILAVKNNTKTEDLATVYHAELYGKRKSKFEALNSDIAFTPLTLDKKMFYFVNKNTEGKEEYDRGIALNELMPINSVGIVTGKDDVLINENIDTLINNVTDFRLCGKGKVAERLRATEIDANFVEPVAYRPFDKRHIYYDPSVVERSRSKVMKNFVARSERERERERGRFALNWGIIMSRTYPYSNWASVFMIDTIAEFGLGGAYPGNGFVVAPLYSYDTKGNASIVATRQQKTDAGYRNVFTASEMAESSIVSNKTAEISSQFPLYLTQKTHGRCANFSEAKLKELFSEVEQPDENSPKVLPEDIMDYIYSSLHSPSYRKKYNEFLKTDFPRVPRPISWSEFWRLVGLGRELRELHLMNSPLLDSYTTTYSIAGDNLIEKPAYTNGRIWINATQYFGNVPETAWDFYIGGYQPAQKWLKDRRGRKLNDADLEHYQRIIKILVETDRIMKEIG